MSTPPPWTSEDLERAEREVRQFATRGQVGDSDWDTLVGKLEDRWQELPPLDPDAARSSSAELLQLVRALRDSPATAEPPSPLEAARAGYAIEGEPGSKGAQVRPAFAERLAGRSNPQRLRDEFSDLWAVDAALWRKLHAHDSAHTELARMWLDSPGRRLVQELAVLGPLAPPSREGVSDFSPDALCAAAGPLPGTPEAREPALDRWRELHAAVPGASLASWQPASNDVGAVLQTLEGRPGDPIFVRGAALAWLLERASTEPFYDLNGIRRDLREDLIPALIAGFPDLERPSAGLPRTLEPRVARMRAAARLETVALQHAARLVVGCQSDEPLARTWSLARWIQSCTFRSPFFGGDEETLAARLRALLPTQTVEASSPPDVLDPSRFRDGEDGLDIAELALVAGAVQHYRPDEEGTPRRPVLLPTPSPLVQALRRVAGRVVGAGEWEVEAVLAEAEPQGGAEASSVRRNALGWPAHHIAPPLVARWLMTQRAIAWLIHVPSEAWRESLKHFEQQPARYEWVAFAVYAEREELPTSMREEAARVWREALSRTEGRLGVRGALGLMAAAVLDQLSPEEEPRLVGLSDEVRVDWRHHGLEALVLAAERYERPDLWRAAMDGLLGMLNEEDLDVQERLKAALLALRRTSSLGSARPEREVYLERIASAVARPPFNQHVGLRRELRRLGLSSGVDPRGER